MKRVFEIEWPDDCGPMWLNRDNLMLCLTTAVYIGPAVHVAVEDVEASEDEMNRLKMLRAAKQLAHDLVDDCSALDDAEYRNLKRLKNDERAVQLLACEILEAAALGPAATDNSDDQ